jgi:hypothetical protein
MNEESFSIGFVAGMILTFVVFLLVFLIAEPASEREIKAIEQCEKELPRNQHCEIYAAPSAKIEG